MTVTEGVMYRGGGVIWRCGSIAWFIYKGSKRRIGPPLDSVLYQYLGSGRPGWELFDTRPPKGRCPLTPPDKGRPMDIIRWERTSAPPPPPRHIQMRHLGVKFSYWSGADPEFSFGGGEQRLCERTHIASAKPEAFPIGRSPGPASFSFFLMLSRAMSKPYF